MKVVDDLAHAALGFVVVTPVAWFAPPWATALSAALVGLVRELEQMRASFDQSFGASRARDVAGFAVGGFLAGLL